MTRATEGRPLVSIGKCAECGGEVLSARRGPPPALCLTCRVRKCVRCGRQFTRPYRGDPKKCAGKFCSHACYRARGPKEGQSSEDS